MRSLPLAEVRNHLSEVVDEVVRTHDRVTITRHGQAVAVVVSPEDLAGMQETLDLLAIPGALEAIREGQADLEEGRTEDWADLRKEFGRP